MLLYVAKTVCCCVLNCVCCCMCLYVAQNVCCCVLKSVCWCMLLYVAQFVCCCVFVCMLLYVVKTVCCCVLKSVCWCVLLCVAKIVCCCVQNTKSSKFPDAVLHTLKHLYMTWMLYMHSLHVLLPGNRHFTSALTERQGDMHSMCCICAQRELCAEHTMS